MMPYELFFCDDSTRVASLPPSEVLKTLYEKDAKDLEGAAKQVLPPTNEVRHYNWTDQNLRFIQISA